MAVKPPSPKELGRIARRFYLHPSGDDLESFLSLMEPALDSYARLDELVEPTLPVKYPRSPGYRPQPEDNPLGAWYWRSEIRGASSGPLTGKTLAIKDNVCVAGMPMMNGTSVLEGYVPDVDATVVTRILDAGGTILGKSVCESLCMSGASHTSDTGPVRNPHDPERTAGGLLQRQRRPRRRRRGRHGHRRRPGGIDQNAGQLVRDLRPQAHIRPRPVHRHIPYRVDHRPHGSDGGNSG